MKLLDSAAYCGPGIWSARPAFWMIVDTGPAGSWAPARLGPAFAGGLTALLPGLREHGRDGVSLPQAGQDREALAAGRLLAHVALELLRLAGHGMGRGSAELLSEPQRVRVVVECFDAALSPPLVRFAVSLLLRLRAFALQGQDGPGEEWRRLVEDLGDFVKNLQARSLDLSTRALVEKGLERGIPWLRISPDAMFVQLGSGCFARRIMETSTCLDQGIGERICRNKQVTAQLLGSVGLPVPRQVRVAAPDQAVAAARVLGWPVVVKPVYLGKGMGVFVGLRSEAEVRQAAEKAFRYGPVVLVEQHVAGDDHRLLVVGGQLVAAARRLPAQVVGNGRDTVRQLVAAANRDPRRGIGFENLLVRLVLDDEALEQLRRVGLGPDSVLAAGVAVRLRGTANISTGGTAVDVTDQVHPDNRLAAEVAAAQSGLAVCGVDFISPDIGRSWQQVGGCIIELNQSPGLRPHQVANPRQDVTGPILDVLFPAARPARIPVAVVTGSNGKTTTCQMLARIFQTAGRVCGLATTQGVFLDGLLLKTGDLAGGAAGAAVLLQPRVEVAVLEAARKGLLRRGLPVDWCDVGAVLNVTGDHVGCDGIETIDDLARIKRLVAEGARQALVLNAEDPLCLAMASCSPASRHCLVAVSGVTPAIARHLADGGRAAVLERQSGGEMITFLTGGQRQAVLAIADIPAAHGGLAACNGTNALFAAAIAWEMGVETENIIAGLRSFQSTFESNPGRLNVYEGLPFRVVVDFAHNPDKYQALIDYAVGAAPSGRRIGVITSSGKRPDEHFRAIGRVCAGAFDHYLLARWEDPRGRGEWEVQELIRAALLGAGVEASRVEVCNREEEAVAKALELARAGDLVVLAVQEHRRCWEQLLRAGEKP